MNRAELQSMAIERLLDAEVLLAGGRWSFAYYVAGYAVECALKSCVLTRMVETGGVFTDRKFAEKCWTHDFEELINLAGLRLILQSGFGASAAFAGFWQVAKACEDTSRYQAKTRAEAEALFEAISHDPDGVMKWVQNYW